MTVNPRTLAATEMAFRDQRRRPLLLALLIIVPAYAITRSIAITQATPRRIGLPNQQVVLTNMKELHGAVMAATRSPSSPRCAACSSCRRRLQATAGW